MKIDEIIETNKWYESTKRNFQLDKLAGIIDDLQHTIGLMYIESYWLLYSNRGNRENTWNGLLGSK